jgi:starch phosphorylase
MGIARRATPYKRADLVLSDPQQLTEAARSHGPIQILFAGKAHPHDHGGKDMIRRIVELSRRFDALVTVAYLENYDMALAQRLTAGADLWLNTPMRPLEASGTSGMKAAMNGVPSFSVLDGWWVEGHAEGVTGWSIGPRPYGPATAAAPMLPPEQDAQDLYLKLRGVILPTFYNDRERWTAVMRQTIAFNASFFNTHRMVQQYAANAYL